MWYPRYWKLHLKGQSGGKFGIMGILEEQPFDCLWGVKAIGRNPCGSLLKSLTPIILRRCVWRSHSSKAALGEWQNSSWDYSFFSWSPFLGTRIQIKTFPKFRKPWNAARSKCNPCFFLCISLRERGTIISSKYTLEHCSFYLFVWSKLSSHKTNM